jgi:hypothetical protein
MPTKPRRVEIVTRRLLKQKWYARFIADNGRVLARTEHYHNLEDLESMLEVYYPEWIIEVIS